jgi:hypothetical protein
MRIFFSFHYTFDHHRARQVMDALLAHPGTSATGFIDDDTIDEMCAVGLSSVYDWIEAEVEQADVVVVLIGAATAGRHFVEYELAQAQKRRRPLLGVRIHALPDADGRTAEPGPSPLFPVFAEHDFVAEDGAGQLVAWAGEAITRRDAQYAAIRDFMVGQVQQMRSAR